MVILRAYLILLLTAQAHLELWYSCQDNRKEQQAWDDVFATPGTVESTFNKAKLERSSKLRISRW